MKCGWLVTLETVSVSLCSSKAGNTGMSHDTQILKQSVTEGDCSELCGFGQSPAQLSPFHSAPKRRCCTCKRPRGQVRRPQVSTGGRAGEAEGQVLLKSTHRSSVGGQPTESPLPPQWPSQWHSGQRHNGTGSGRLLSLSADLVTGTPASETLFPEGMERSPAFEWPQDGDP